MQNNVIYPTTTFPAGTLTATVSGLPTDGRVVRVALISTIDGADDDDPFPDQCQSGEGSSPNPAHPTQASTPGLAYALNSAPSGQPVGEGGVAYTYTLDDGAAYIQSCGPVDGDSSIVAVPYGSAGQTFRIRYVVYDTATTGNHAINCTRSLVCRREPDSAE